MACSKYSNCVDCVNDVAQCYWGITWQGVKWCASNLTSFGNQVLSIFQPGQICVGSITGGGEEQEKVTTVVITTGSFWTSTIGSACGFVLVLSGVGLLVWIFLNKNGIKTWLKFNWDRMKRFICCRRRISVEEWKRLIAMTSSSAPISSSSTSALSTVTNATYIASTANAGMFQYEVVDLDASAQYDARTETVRISTAVAGSKTKQSMPPPVPRRNPTVSLSFENPMYTDRTLRKSTIDSRKQMEAKEKQRKEQKLERETAKKIKPKQPWL